VNGPHHPPHCGWCVGAKPTVTPLINVWDASLNETTSHSVPFRTLSNRAVDQLPTHHGLSLA